MGWSRALTGLWGQVLVDKLLKQLVMDWQVCLLLMHGLGSALVHWGGSGPALSTSLVPFVPPDRCHAWVAWPGRLGTLSSRRHGRAGWAPAAAGGMAGQAGHFPFFPGSTGTDARSVSPGVSKDTSGWESPSHPGAVWEAWTPLAPWSLPGTVVAVAARWCPRRHHL